MNDEKRGKLGLLPREPVSLSDTDLVAMLRGDDNEKRRAALDALFPNTSAVLLVARRDSVGFSTTTQIDAGRVFNGLLYVAQQAGSLLGLQLNWVPDPAQDKKLVVAQPGALVPG